MTCYFIVFSSEDDPQDLSFHIVSAKSFKAAQRIVVKKEGNEPMYCNGLPLDDLIRLLQRYAAKSGDATFIEDVGAEKPRWIECLPEFGPDGNPRYLDAVTGATI